MKFTMTSTPLHKIDLNLLVVLNVLLREKSVGRAADRLNLTSSAVSHALKRLRLMFEDELLVRDGQRMVPTSRAQGLAETLPILLAHVEQSLAPPLPFDPTTSTRSFRLAAPDFVSPLLPRLLGAIANEAPGVRVELQTYSPTALIDMRQGRYDALIAPDHKQSDDMRGIELGSWSWLTFGREGHPAFGNWSLKSWAQYPHIQVSATSPSGRSPIDIALAKKGTERKIAAVVPKFSMAAPVLAETDMLLTVPSVAMKNYAELYDLASKEMPLELSPVTLTLFHSAVSGNTPETRWFLTHILDAAREVLR
jgi:DNA-binding transcriptional LysR family regulator